jgi:hypothetical protein
MKARAYTVDERATWMPVLVSVSRAAVAGKHDLARVIESSIDDITAAMAVSFDADKTLIESMEPGAYLAALAEVIDVNAAALDEVLHGVR